MLDLLGFLDNNIVGALFFVQSSGLALNCFQIRSHIGDIIFISDFDTLKLKNLKLFVVNQEYTCKIYLGFGSKHFITQSVQF